ncbi:hypothetical protein DXG03_000019 [Asterophora parasitica]|uniref:3-isopropylmalate dehydratase n=1 Tax=Asterophora parasitica TaxID=117018 RepID=A0A9P7KFL1_9AGAR|nr:hypothetical protein DXG03_000019 [Asterophora parasitica]
MPAPIPAPRTLYDKIWDDHVVDVNDDGLALIYIDRHLVHEVTSPQAFEGLRTAGRPVRRPDCTLATVDHNVPTASRKNFTTVESFIAEPDSRAQCAALEDNVKEFGIVHVIGPEQGFTLPGITCVCGDSHTSTHGAFGSLAFGIGTSEVEHVLATQTLLQKKGKNMRITVDGDLHEGVTSKDVILHIIGVIGTAGGTGCVIEYAGSVFRGFSMEARMSVCNMSIEAGARAGMVAPDDVTFEYLKNRPLAPKGDAWDRAVLYWRALKSDEGAKFDIEVNIPASDIIPTITWGTSPQDVVPITGSVPDPSTISDPTKRDSAERALAYMGLTANMPMQEISIDKVFIGSCTNSRIEDLRSAARIVLAAGSVAKVAPNVYAMIVPGSGLIKQQAEAEGLDAIFKRAGFDWREAGCSMCLGMNPDQLAPGERCASTSNRNFEGRQGAGGRTHLLSPAMAAAAAITGKLTDVRKFLGVDAEAQIAAGPQLKLASAFDFLDAPEASPAPKPAQTETSSSSAPLPPTETPSSVEKFTIVKGITAPLHIENVDTDMIIPKQFLKTLKRTGLANALFYTLRKDPHTGKDTDFILNRAPYDNAKILVCTGKNFGCGSSREHAPWSLYVSNLPLFLVLEALIRQHRNDFGIRCIIAPSFADIFRNNSMQNGMLPVTLPEEDCRALAEDAEAGLELEVDLEKQEVRRPNGKAPIPFVTDVFRRHCLLNGLDDIALTMQRGTSIEEFEQRRSQQWPWLDGFGYKGSKIPATRQRASKKMDCLIMNVPRGGARESRTKSCPNPTPTPLEALFSLSLPVTPMVPAPKPSTDTAQAEASNGQSAAAATGSPSKTNKANSAGPDIKPVPKSQQKTLTSRSSKPIINWFQRKLAGTGRGKRAENRRAASEAIALGKSRTGSTSHSNRVTPRVASSPVPTPTYTSGRHHGRHDSLGVHNQRRTISLNDGEDCGHDFLAEAADDHSLDQSSLARESTWSPSMLEADDDASVRPIPPSAPPSPSPSRSSSSYLSDPRTFRSIAASTKPTTLLSVDMNGNGMAHIAQAPTTPNYANRFPHVRNSSANNPNVHSSGASITFSSLPHSSSRPSSLSNPGTALALPQGHGAIQAPLHTAHHPRNNPRPSSPPLDNASVLTLASSAYAIPGIRSNHLGHSTSPSARGLGDSLSHFGGSITYQDVESTSQFVLGDDERLEERDVDASVRALRPRSSRRGSWESEASGWSARVQHGPGTSLLARERSLRTANSVKTGAFSADPEAYDPEEHVDHDDEDEEVQVDEAKNDKAVPLPVAAAPKTPASLGEIDPLPKASIDSSSGHAANRKVSTDTVERPHQEQADEHLNPVPEVRFFDVEAYVEPHLDKFLTKQDAQQGGIDVAG